MQALEPGSEGEWRTQGRAPLAGLAQARLLRRAECFEGSGRSGGERAGVVAHGQTVPAPGSP